MLATVLCVILALVAGPVVARLALLIANDLYWLLPDWLEEEDESPEEVAYVTKVVMAVGTVTAVLGAVISGYAGSTDWALASALAGGAVPAAVLLVIGVVVTLCWCVYKAVRLLFRQVIAMYAACAWQRIDDAYESFKARVKANWSVARSRSANLEKHPGSAAASEEDVLRQYLRLVKKQGLVCCPEVLAFVAVHKDDGVLRCLHANLKALGLRPLA